MRKIKGLKRFIAVIMTAIFILNDAYIVNAEGIAPIEDTTEKTDVTEEAAEEETIENITDTSEEESITETVQENSDSENNNIDSESDIDEVGSLPSDILDDEIDIDTIYEDIVSESEYEDLTLTSSMTLVKDMTVNNLNIYDKVTLDLNGYTLNVKGEYYQSKGTLNFNNGQLYCDKNMSFGNAVVINMNNVNDCLSVGGNLTINSSYNKDISAGTIYLYGDFYSATTFNAKNNNTFVFAGNKKQTININSDSNFNILEFRNFSDEGIYIKYDLKYNKLIDNDCKIKYNDLGGERGYTLEDDTEIDGIYYLVAGRLNLNGHTLTINGDLIQGGGEIYINGGSLIINGDYEVATLKQYKDKDGNITYIHSAGSGTLTMDNSEDYIHISGSYINNLNNTKKTNVKLTDGTMEVNGDFDADLYLASGNQAR